MPGIPHWNLEKATNILREDEGFRLWDDTWGGIFSSDTPERISLVGYVINHHSFAVAEQNPIFGMEKSE